MAVLQTLCLRVKNLIITHEPHILFCRFYISILPIIAPSTACHEEVSETHSYKKIKDFFTLAININLFYAIQLLDY